MATTVGGVMLEHSLDCCQGLLLFLSVLVRGGDVVIVVDMIVPP